MKSRRVRTVLVVDDDERYLAGLWRLMPEREILVERDDRRVVRRARRERPDLVLIDLWLANDRCGEDLVRRLRRTQLDIGIVLVSAGMAPAIACITSKRSAADFAWPKAFDRPAFETLLGIVESGKLPVLRRPEEVQSFAEVRREHARHIVSISGGNKAEAARKIRVHRATLVRALGVGR